MHLDLGHLSQAQYRIVMEVALLHLPVHDIDIAEGHTAKTIGQPPFYLALDTQRVDGKTTVHNAHHPIDGEVAVICDGDFNGLRHWGDVIDASSHTPPSPGAQGRVPSTLFLEHAKHAIHARVIFSES